MFNPFSTTPEVSPLLQISLARYLLAQQAMSARHALFAAAAEHQEPIQIQASEPTSTSMSEASETNEANSSHQQQEQALEPEVVWDWDMLLDGEESK